jgi:hypothetical protein
MASLPPSLRPYGLSAACSSSGEDGKKRRGSGEVRCRGPTESRPSGLMLFQLLGQKLN